MAPLISTPISAKVVEKLGGWLAALSGGALLFRCAWTASRDPGLALGIFLHLLLGVALTLVVFSAGIGLIVLADRRHTRLEDLLLCAFLPGTLVLAAAAAAAVFVPLGGVVAAVIIIGSLVPLARYRPDIAALSRVGTTLALVLPVSLFLATMMALRFHGPSATLSAILFGDSSLYLRRAISLTHGIMPLRNLGVEGRRQGLGSELLPSLLMSALLRWRWFDPFLFMTTSLVVLAVASLGLMLALLTRAWGVGAGALGATARWIVIGLVAGAMRYPSWLVESPPLAFAFPIIVSAVYLWRRDRADHRVPWRALIVSVLGSAVSKVVTFAVLVPLVLAGSPRALIARMNRRTLFLGFIALAAIAVYVALMLASYLPEYLPMLRYRDEVYGALPLARDIGAILLAIGASRMGLAGLAPAAWSGVALFLFLPFLFNTTLFAVMIVVALAIVEQPERLARARAWIIVALVLLLPWPLFSEPGSRSVALGWVLTVWFIVSSAVAACGTASASSPGEWRRQAAAGLAAMLMLVLVAIGTGAYPARAVPDSRHPPGQLFVVLTPEMTPEMRDIWLAVRAHTPPDALIFTDQTGATESRLGGWNDYALISDRQFFVVSWGEDVPLRNDPARRAEWLKRNAEVLSGVLRPDQLHLSRKYTAYFAVISARRQPPPGAALIYANAHYRLYWLAP